MKPHSVVLHSKRKKKPFSCHLIPTVVKKLSQQTNSWYHADSQKQEVTFPWDKWGYRGCVFTPWASLTDSISSLDIFFSLLLPAVSKSSHRKQHRLSWGLTYLTEPQIMHGFEHDGLFKFKAPSRSKLQLLFIIRGKTSPKSFSSSACCIINARARRTGLLSEENAIFTVVCVTESHS